MKLLNNYSNRHPELVNVILNLFQDPKGDKMLKQVQHDTGQVQHDKRYYSTPLKLLFY